MSAHSVTTPHCSTGTISSVSTLTVVACLSTVLLHVVDPSVTRAVTLPLSTVRVHILTVGVGVGAGVRVVSIVIRRSVVDGAIRS